MKNLFSTILLCLLSLVALSQTIPVGSLVLEDAYRREQLLGVLDSTVSFTVRPVYPVQTFRVNNSYDPDGYLAFNRWTDFDGINRMGWQGWDGHGAAFSLQMLPMERITQYVSHHPFSMNDGGMIPAVGLQSFTRAGVYGEVGFFRKLGERGAAHRRGIVLSVQLQPEWITAENLDYEGFPDTHSDQAWTEYWLTQSRIDWPEHFGDGSYSRVSWGQSSARISSGPVSFGVSNENLWWGPGMRNSILMSNTSPGFPHLTFNTTRPIKTPIGSFEFQVVGAYLDSSGFRSEAPDSTNFGFQYYYQTPKSLDTIYFNGVVMSYQPRWIPGLFLGFTRSFQSYVSDLDGTLRGYLPVILPLAKESNGEEGENSANQNQLASFFGRWLMPKSHAEVYFEFGRDDHAWNLRDLLLEPFHSRAYMVGFRKMVPLKNPKKGSLLVGFEHTQLQNSRSGQYRSSGPWYLHSQIRQGYTNQGQMLGAGIGPGGNMQTLELSYLSLSDPRVSSAELADGSVHGDDGIGGTAGSIGVRLERYVHNNDFHYEAIKDIRAHWVDINAGLFGHLAFKNFIIHAKMDFITSMNYQHLYEPSIIIDAWWNPGVRVFNFVGSLGIVYRF